jgi:hypothetical protein
LSHWQSLRDTGCAFTHGFSWAIIISCTGTPERIWPKNAVLHKQRTRHFNVGATAVGRVFGDATRGLYRKR